MAGFIYTLRKNKRVKEYKSKRVNQKSNRLCYKIIYLVNKKRKEQMFQIGEIHRRGGVYEINRGCLRGKRVKAKVRGRGLRDKRVGVYEINGGSLLDK